MKSDLMTWIIKLIVVILFFGLAVLVGRAVVTDVWQMFGLLAVGLLLGLFVSFFDRQWLSKYYLKNQQNPDNLDQLSPGLVVNKIGIQPYATRSTLFLLILVPFSLFIVTSTGSPLGVGLTIGLVIDVVVDMLKLARQKDRFVQTFLQQFQSNFTETEVLMITGGSLIWLVVLFVLAIK